MFSRIISFVTFTSLAIHLVVALPAPPFAHETKPSSNAASLEARAATNGAYAIMSPADGVMFFDEKHTSFFAFFKFGDGKPDRYQQYETHNPTFAFKHHLYPANGEGKKMEKATLSSLAKAPAHAVEEALNAKGNPTEWYKIYLGKDKAAAIDSKAVLRKLLSEFGDKDMTVTATSDAYVKDFNEKVAKAAKKT